MVPQNIEIKVACTIAQWNEVRAQLGSRILDAVETLCHCDTYFRAPQGRLKLREIERAGERSAELIQYSRPDQPGARTSTYHRLALDSEQATTLSAMLDNSVGRLVTVRKQRQVAIWRSTRIHLDHVDELGHFVELETVLGDRPESTELGRTEFDSVVDWLGLAGLPTIPGSYSDLLIAKGHVLS